MSMFDFKPISPKQIRQIQIDSAIKCGMVREVEHIFGCPYCWTPRQENSGYGCCGESSAHFGDLYQFVATGEDATVEDYEKWTSFIKMIDWRPS